MPSYHSSHFACEVQPGIKQGKEHNHVQGDADCWRKVIWECRDDSDIMIYFVALWIGVMATHICPEPHQNHLGSLVPHHKASSRTHRSAGLHTETPQRHTKWALMREGGGDRYGVWNEVQYIRH